MSLVNLIHSTPNGDDLVAYMARVSNPDNQNNTETSARLIKYLIKHKHWSPFEMEHVAKSTLLVVSQHRFFVIVLVSKSFHNVMLM